MALLFGIAAVKLFDVQVVQPTRYVTLGERQRLVRQPLSAPRGTISDREGVELALSVPQTTIFADPTLVRDPVGEAQTLAPVLGMDAGTLAQKLHAHGRFVYLARMVADDLAQRVKHLHLPGIAFVPEMKRVYPAGEVARGVLGTTSIDGVGDSGLEAQYNRLLKGTAGEAEYETSKAGVIAGGKSKVTAARPGDDIALTIDRSLQYQTEQLLGQQVTATGSKGGIAIVSDPSTGEILSLADVTADPKTHQVQPSSNNGALTTVFEPGSVNKVITVSAALEQGKVNPETIFNVPPSLQVGGYSFSDAERHPSNLSVTDILTISSNLGTIEVGRDVGPKGIDTYLRKFGLGTPTALHFPNESPGLMLPLDQWSASSMGSIPIGQGISVTPMQMLEAYNVIANDGVYVAPKLVAATYDSHGDRHDTRPSATHRVISTRTAQEVRGMLVNVVRTGTGTAAQIPGYTVAGKTGTARKPLAKHAPGNGYIDPSGNYHYVATFVGMAPAEHPKLSVIVVMDEPTNGYFAAQAAAPLFQRLASFALREFRIPPAAPGDDPFVGVPEVDSALASTNDEPNPAPTTQQSTTTTTTTPGASSQQTTTTTSTPAGG